MEAAVSPTVRRARRGGDDPFDEDRLKDFLRDDDEKTGGRRIRCPLCGWTPRSEDRWMCTCLHAWNTFDTRGRCPGCGQQWLHTQCLHCGAWSPHDEWYADEPEE